jgi:hydroxymethylpyrimidine pyrophosphatase-like HAD family hydrolase
MNTDHDLRARSAYFKAVAVDFDGTLTEDGTPSPSVLSAIRSARELGLRILLVTSRTLDELSRVFPDAHDHFDMTVAENGAILRVAEGHRWLARPVDPELAGARHQRSSRRGDCRLRRGA